MDRNYLKETVECLESYAECKNRLNSKVAFLNKLKADRAKREREVGITSMNYDVMPAKTNKITSKVEEIATKNIQMELDLEEEIDSLSYYIKRIDLKLVELKEEWKEVLNLKYIEGYTWEYVAKVSGQSESTCRRQAKEAIKALADKLLGEKSYIDLPLFRYFYIEQERLEQI